MRMKRRIRTDVCLILCGILVWFLADARQLRLEAAKALTLCAGTVIPALFPFMVVTGLLVRLGFGQWLAPDMAGLMASLFPLARLRRVRAAAGAGRRLSHRRPHGGGAVRLRGPDPAGGGAASDLLQQLQPRVPHQCAGCGRVRQRPDRTVALADPRLRRPFHRSAVPGTGPGPENRSSRHFLSGPSLPAAFVSSVRDSAGTMLSVCAFVTFFYVLISPLTALPGPWAALAVGCGGAVLPDAPPAL